MQISKKRWVLTPLALAFAVLVAFTAVRASAATLTVSTASLPTGEVNVAYAQTLTATGGTAPYTWALTAGSLPAGLVLDPATGSISGTSSAVTTANFTVQVTDASAGTATRALTIVVQPAVAVGTSSLPDGQVAQAYSQTLAALGGVSPFAWTIQSGALPAGLSLNSSTGAITGSPTTAGPSNFTVRVTDALAQHADQALSLTVHTAGTLAITTSSLPNGTVGAAYSQALTASGGTAPYVWTVSVGTLPAGLTLSAGGVLSGTPTTSGTSTFTVMVADSAAGSATRAFTLAVSPLLITTATLSAGEVGAAYSEALAASGGTPPYTWVVTSGSLPTGLSLNAAGVISGTPTTPGTSTFTAQVTDSLGATATRILVLEVDGIDTAQAGEKVTICHIPPGNPDNAHTISVGAPALDAHLAHGDTEGECVEVAATAEAGTASADDGPGNSNKHKENEARDKEAREKEAKERGRPSPSRGRGPR